MNVHGEVQFAQVVPGAPADGAPAGGGLHFFLPLIAFFLIMYALILRPQQKQQKEQKAMLAKIKKGDRIVTSGGIHAEVTGLTEDVLTVKIANNVSVKINRSAVSARLAEAGGKKS